ncbi:Hypothetical predicted protein [Paramuricea clavata]|uniref:Uncharacterized protein n=1 Tax=Paramuricea clavata TaxID=317549 RepID=A0A6S7IW12_PARCT|nr:Hypothetical predicted protein [Paramuricea clavata]
MLTGFESTDDVESSKLSPALVLAQLLAFNSAKNRKSTRVFCNNADHETPVAIYIAFLIHSKTRSKDLVNRLHSLGLCISYDRLSTLSTYLGNSVIDQFDKDGLHLKDKDDGTFRPSLDLQKDKLQSKLLKQLPTEYTSILPCVLKKKDIVTPTKTGASQEVSIALSFGFVTSVCGDWLSGSGWVHLLVLSKVATPGKANAMLTAFSNITFCRYLHQVTAC